MVSKAFFATVGLAVLATAAPQKRQGANGVYICPRPYFTGFNGDHSTCRWKAVPAGVCKHLDWFDLKDANAERHISFAPDQGSWCTVFEDFNCNKDAGRYARLAPPGLDDVWAYHESRWPGQGATQFKSYMCSIISLDDSGDQAIKSIDP